MPLKPTCAALFFLAGAGLNAETGYDAWLRYARLDDAALRPYRNTVPAVLTIRGDSAVVASAGAELIRGIRGMTGRTLRPESGLPKEPAILIGTLEALRPNAPSIAAGVSALKPGGFLLRTVALSGNRCLVIAGADDDGVLYGAFALLRKIAAGEPIGALDEKESPAAPIRWVNQWDNLDGSIERGYGGRSLFWESGHVRADLGRVSDYGRMLSSVGINGATVDNVNADQRLLSPEFIPQLARIADALRPWGVHVAVSVDFGSPQSLGGLDTFDPLDPRVAGWWRARADEVYMPFPTLRDSFSRPIPKGGWARQPTTELTPTQPMWWRAH